MYVCMYVRLGLNVKPYTKDKIGSLKKTSLAEVKFAD